MERVARMKRQDNKWSTIYLLSSFLVHHKSVNVPKALSNTKSNVTIRTPYSHSRSSKVTGLNTAHDTLQRFFVWYPVNKLSSWQSYAAIQRTATRDLIHKACGNSAIAESLRTFQAKLMRRLRKSYAIFTKPPLTLRNLRKVFATTVRKTSNIGQPIFASSGRKLEGHWKKIGALPGVILFLNWIAIHQWIRFGIWYKKLKAKNNKTRPSFKRWTWHINIWTGHFK